MQDFFGIPGLRFRYSNIMYRGTFGADQTLTTGTTTIVNWDLTRYDPDGMHNDALNNSQIVVPRAGQYLIAATVWFASNATGLRQVAIRVGRLGGASSILYLSRVFAGSNSISATAIAIRQVRNADYFEISGYQDSGGNLAILGNTSQGDDRTNLLIAYVGEDSRNYS